MNGRRSFGLGLTTRLPETALQQSVHLSTNCKAVVGQGVKADHSIHLSWGVQVRRKANCSLKFLCSMLLRLNSIFLLKFNSLCHIFLVLNHCTSFNNKYLPLNICSLFWWQSIIYFEQSLKAKHFMLQVSCERFPNSKALVSHNLHTSSSAEYVSVQFCFVKLHHRSGFNTK